MVKWLLYSHLQVALNARNPFQRIPPVPHLRIS